MQQNLTIPPKPSSRHRYGPRFGSATTKLTDSFVDELVMQFDNQFVLYPQLHLRSKVYVHEGVWQCPPWERPKGWELLNAIEPSNPKWRH